MRFIATGESDLTCLKTIGDPLGLLTPARIQEVRVAGYASL